MSNQNKSPADIEDCMKLCQHQFLANIRFKFGYFISGLFGLVWVEVDV